MPPSPAPPPLPSLPPPHSPAAPAGPRRRPLLAGALGALGTLGLTAGCSGGSDEDAKAAEHSPEAERLREAAAHRSRTLLARYDATAAEHGPLAGRLAPLRAAVAMHAQAFGGRTEKNGGKGEHRPEVPGEEKAALSALAEAERRTASAHTTALVEAPPELARMLASVAAAGAAHAYLLGQPGGAPQEKGGSA